MVSCRIGPYPRSTTCSSRTRGVRKVRVTASSVSAPPGQRKGRLVNQPSCSNCCPARRPARKVANPTAHLEHEATTSKIGEDQIFYCNQRGISTQDAVNMIVNGFCKEVFRELPMEFAVEAQKLLGVSLEGSVG